MQSIDNFIGYFKALNSRTHVYIVNYVDTCLYLIKIEYYWDWVEMFVILYQLEAYYDFVAAKNVFNMQKKAWQSPQSTHILN